eukprot:5575529-Pleurochrysis_carterae.AAC.1
MQRLLHPLLVCVSSRAPLLSLLFFQPQVRRHPSLSRTFGGLINAYFDKNFGLENMRSQFSRTNYVFGGPLEGYSSVRPPESPLYSRERAPPRQNRVVVCLLANLFGLHWVAGLGWVGKLSRAGEPRPVAFAATLAVLVFAPLMIAGSSRAAFGCSGWGRWQVVAKSKRGLAGWSV